MNVCSILLSGIVAVAAFVPLDVQAVPRNETAEFRECGTYVLKGFLHCEKAGCSLAVATGPKTKFTLTLAEIPSAYLAYRDDFIQAKFDLTKKGTDPLRITPIDRVPLRILGPSAPELLADHPIKLVKKRACE